MYDVITWRQSVKGWSYSLAFYSIEFLDLNNLENDTNKVAAKTSKIYNPRYNTGYTLTSCKTSSRDVKVLSADRTVLEMIALNFSTSKTLKTISL